MPSRAVTVGSHLTSCTNATHNVHHNCNPCVWGYLLPAGLPHGSRVPQPKLPDALRWLLHGRPASRRCRRRAVRLRCWRQLCQTLAVAFPVLIFDFGLGLYYDSTIPVEPQGKDWLWSRALSFWFVAPAYYFNFKIARYGLPHQAR
jgi:hypothetical protein